jgi:hypothetical protein
MDMQNLGMVLVDAPNKILFKHDFESGCNPIHGFKNEKYIPKSPQYLCCTDYWSLNSVSTFTFTLLLIDITCESIIARRGRHIIDTQVNFPR